VRVLGSEPPWTELAQRRRERATAAGAHSGGRRAVTSPMQGTVLAVHVAEGDSVVPGQLLCIVEAMKMENEIHADHGGVVTQLTVAAGQPITAGQTICVIDAGG
jgi:acetyl-CoA/propionyl-CoA carboxylase biotin carboxyl carrier protein